MSSQVVLDSPVEDVDVQEVRHHPDEGAALVVRDVVEDLVNLGRVVDGHGHRVGRFD